ncbi:MAG: hypothetical protein J5822_02725 [Eubacteriaceae bacterium]|nr:hypothetical protein [Eubacteriaceae bacterium]
MENREELLFTDKQLVRLIWPLFVEQLLSVLMGKDVLWVWYAMYADWMFRTVIFSREFFFKQDISKM